MGFFSSAAKVGGMVANPLTQASLAKDAISGKGGEGGNQVEQVDPRLKELRDAQGHAASAYRSGLAGNRDAQYGMAADQSRRNLASQIAGVKRDSNQRGLLYSGLRQGAEQSARANEAANLANQRYAINEATGNQADQLEDQAINSDFQVAGAQNNLNDLAYQKALGQANQRNQATSQFLSAGGAVAGAARRG